MKKPKFEFYTRLNGHTEFLEFLQTIPIKDKQKLVATIATIQEHGLLVAQRMEWVKKLDDDIFEIRSKVGLLLTFKGHFIFMLSMNATSSPMALPKKHKKHPRVR